MSLLDLVILITLCGFTAYGFSAGLIRAAVSLIGKVVAIVVTIRIYTPVAAWMLPSSLSGHLWVQVFVFLLLLGLLSRLIAWVVDMIVRVFDVLSVIPFTKILNRLLGTVFGCLQGIVVISAVLVFVSILPSVPEGLSNAMTTSRIVGILMAIGNLFLLLSPSVLNRVQEFLRQA